MAIGKSEKIIGIDLGTTNSCVAVLEGESVRILENDESGTGKGHITPSVVSFDKDARPCNVGEPAKNQVINSDGISVIYAFKRLIGRRFDDEAVQRDIKDFPYPIIKADNGDAWVEINGKRKSPLEVSSQVLRKLKEVAEKKLCESVESAVITVPAYFDNSQRQATKEAGRIAGLCIRRIINEPTSAALAYVVGKGPRDSKIAIYDLGGGTFDISIIETSKTEGEHHINVMSINGDTDLGGVDFDDRIIGYLCEEFKKEYAMDLRDSDDPVTLIRLGEAAESAKIKLSTIKHTDINIPFIASDEGGPKHLTMKLTRAKLESLVEDLIARTLEPCRIAMKDAGISASDIDDVILVGGQTRMPKVREAAESIFGKEPRWDINVDEAVAIGAAIQGGILTGDKGEIVSDCTPLSLGVETLGGVMTKIIEKNTKIPVRRQKTFTTKEDNLTSVIISVFQGERQQAEGNKLLDQFVFDGIPPVSRKEPIEVIFDIDDDGILDVSVMHEATGKITRRKITGQPGLSKEEIDQAIKAAETHALEDKIFRELADARNDADSEIYNAKKVLNGLSNPDIGQSKKAAIERAISDLEDSMKDDNATEIKARTRILAEISGRSVRPSLYEVALSGRPDAAKEAVDDGADPNEKDKDGWTPLHEAAWNGHLEAVKRLVNAGAESSATNEHGHTPLHLAAFNGHLATTKVLVDAGANPNARDEKGTTPLHNAVVSGHIATIDELINAGAAPNAKKENHATPLHTAAATLKVGVDVIEVLVNAGGDPNAMTEKGLTPLHNAALSGHIAAVEVLVKLGVDPSTKGMCGETPLHHAAQNGHTDVVKVLINVRADLNATSNIRRGTPLHVAAFYGNTAAVKALIEAGAERNARVDESRVTPLHCAAFGGNASTVKTLINAGVDLNAKDPYGMTPLHHAAQYGRVDTLRVLLEANIDPNSKDNEGSTALHQSALGGHVDAIEVLAKAGAKPNAKCQGDTTRGITPLHLAANNDHADAICALLKVGANPNSRDDDGGMPLHQSAINGGVNAAKALINAGADLNAEMVRNGGWTPLIIAIKEGHIGVIDLLINAGVDPNFKGGTGGTPLHFAAYHGNSDAIMALVQAGADIYAIASDGAKPSDAAAEQGYGKIFAAAVHAARRSD
ncbi:MAG: molecular chaperone DnaK [Ectothiorhodospiraceae bacterium AqS1]|nr:molecular chaperone DnaK [Ectothiorhodospiraceae bacterium AqS1]